MMMTVNSCFSYFALTQYPDTFLELELASPIPPVICIAFITILIAYPFLSIYSFAADAILQSFLLDEELRF